MEEGCTSLECLVTSWYGKGYLQELPLKDTTTLSISPLCKRFITFPPSLKQRTICQRPLSMVCQVKSPSLTLEILQLELQQSSNLRHHRCQLKGVMVTLAKVDMSAKVDIRSLPDMMTPNVLNITDAPI